jgi:hypothetical protein
MIHALLLATQILVNGQPLVVSTIESNGTIVPSTRSHARSPWK